MKNVNSFKRVLKELGIYNYFLRERKKNLGGMALSVDEIFKYCDEPFNKIIDFSLTWVATKTPDMWVELYDNAAGLSCSDLLKDNDAIEKLKGIVKKNKKH